MLSKSLIQVAEISISLNFILVFVLISEIIEIEERLMRCEEDGDEIDDNDEADDGPDDADDEEEWDDYGGKNA